MECELLPADFGSDAAVRQLIDLLPTMAWAASADGSVEFVNRECCVFTGLPREQLLGSGMAECIHPEDRKFRPGLPTSHSAAVPFQYEFRARRHDGQYVRCIARAVPAFDAFGRVTRWIGTTTEIEEIRRAADQLKVQEEHLQLALESADIGIWRLKLPNYDLTVDERTRRHLDLDTYEIIGYEPKNHIHPHDWDKSAAQVPGSDGRFVTEHRVRQRDGSYRWQAIHWQLWPEGEGENAPAVITGTSMDVTARKEAEEKAEELGQRYRIALAAAGLGAWSAEVDQGHIHLDDRARAHFCTDQSNLTFRECLALVYEPDREPTSRRVRRQFADWPQKSRATVEFRIQHPNGELRWISAQMQIIPTPHDSDRQARVIGITRDITEFKHADERIKRLNTELERRVQERTAELRAANEELESFAYTVSHDLRAPLRAMWGFTDALIEDYGDSLPPQAHAYLQQVIDGSRHLGEIIDGLLTLSRSTRGSLQRDPVDLSSMAERILRDLAHAEPGRHVMWAIQPGLRAQGDSRMIDAVLRNLLGNAWKYTGHRADAVVRFYAEMVGGERVFCVEDNGAGFNMNHAEKLFQPFQRLHRQDEFAGLGIGLATVQRIVHRHGGKVSGTGNPGQGATFRFTLPSPDEATERSAQSV